MNVNQIKLIYLSNWIYMRHATQGVRSLTLVSLWPSKWQKPLYTNSGLLYSSPTDFSPQRQFHHVFVLRSTFTHVFVGIFVVVNFRCLAHVRCSTSNAVGHLYAFQNLTSCWATFSSGLHLTSRRYLRSDGCTVYDSTTTQNFSVVLLLSLSKLTKGVIVLFFYFLSLFLLFFQPLSVQNPFFLSKFSLRLSKCHHSC